MSPVTVALSFERTWKTPRCPHPAQRTGGRVGSGSAGAAGVFGGGTSPTSSCLSACTRSALSSSMLSSVSCETTSMPMARICSSMNGSSSSTTTSLSTLDAKSLTRHFGSGFVQPSFRIEYSGNISFTYWKATAEVTKPNSRFPSNTLLSCEAHAALRISSVRVCAARRWLRANMGTGIVRVMSRL